MNKFNVLVADDHPILRMGLKTLFQSDSKINVVGEAKSGDELIQKTQLLHPDIILLDYYLGQDDGANMTQVLKRVSPKTHVLAYSHSSEPIIIKKIIKAGGDGFVTKSETNSNLIQALYAVMSGEKYYSESIMDVVKQYQSSEKISEPQLTNRELEILELIAKELSNKEIAGKLYISPRTVETHKRNIMQKLHTNSSIGLLNYYYKVLQA